MEDKLTVENRLLSFVMENVVTVNARSAKYRVIWTDPTWCPYQGFQVGRQSYQETLTSEALSVATTPAKANQHQQILYTSAF